MSHITSSEFSKRFAALILGARDLPKKPIGFHVLLVSALIGLDPEKDYAESELNEMLQDWAIRYGANFGLDHITLRRYLIDANYLSRDPSGSVYRLEASDHPYSYDPEIRSIDLEELIIQAKDDRERRKQQYSGPAQ